MTLCQELTQPTHPKPPFTKSLQPPEPQHPSLSLIQYHWILWPEWLLVFSSSSVPPASLQKQHLLQNLGNHCSWQNSPNLGSGTLPILTTFCCHLGTLIKYAAETITSYCFTQFWKPSVVNMFLLRSLSSSAEVCLKASSASSISEREHVAFFCQIMLKLWRRRGRNAGPLQEWERQYSSGKWENYGKNLLEIQIWSNVQLVCSFVLKSNAIYILTCW